MRTSKFVTATALLLLLAQGPLASAAAKPAAAKPAGAKPAGAKASGQQLLSNARLAVAGIYKAAKASQGKLDPKNKKQAPFWQAVSQMNSTLDDAGRQVKTKDKKLAATLSKGSETLAKLKTVWPRVGVANAQVASYLGKLDNAYTALRSARGAEGGRARQAGPLTALEKARFEKIKASQAEFSKKIGNLQAKAKAKKDRGTEASLTRLLEKSNRIAQAQLAVDSFLLAIVLLDQLQGEWEGYSYYVGPDYRAEWVEIDVWVETSFTSYDSWYVESFESYSEESWTTWETSFELSEEFEYEVTDVTSAELASFDTELDASFSYEELSWESYSEELVTAEMEETVYEEADDNLDVAAETWEEEGLEIEADEMMDAEDLEEFDEDDEAEADEEMDESDEDEGDEGEEGDEEEADEEDEGEEGEADEEDAGEDEGDEEAEDEGEEDAEEDDVEDDDDDTGDEGEGEDEDAESEDEGEGDEDEGDEGEDDGGDEVEDDEPPVTVPGTR